MRNTSGREAEVTNKITDPASDPHSANVRLVFLPIRRVSMAVITAAAMTPQQKTAGAEAKQVWTVHDVKVGRQH